jgi:sterol desaturase/sphingolipid hydroxylase (fatty acid hydroxylase superfamily)
MSFGALIDLFAQAWPALVSYDAARNVGVIGGVFLAVLGVLHLTRWRGRIQAHRPRLADYARELGYLALTALVFGLIGFGTFVGTQLGVLRIVTASPADDAVSLAVGAVVLIVAHDAYFYWTHRLMHQPRLFRFFHRGHHRSRAPTVLAAYAFDWPEAIVQALFVPLMAFLTPVHATALLAFLSFMIVRNAIGHSGVELYPRWFGRSRLTAWNTTVTHHDLHHQHGGANFGLYFRWWDQLMGTEHPDYAARFEQATRPRAAQPGGVVRGQRWWTTSPESRVSARPSSLQKAR